MSKYNKLGNTLNKSGGHSDVRSPLQQNKVFLETGQYDLFSDAPTSVLRAKSCPRKPLLALLYLRSTKPVASSPGPRGNPERDFKNPSRIKRPGPNPHCPPPPLLPFPSSPPRHLPVAGTTPAYSPQSSYAGKL